VRAVSIPVVACGGAGSVADLGAVVREAGAAAAAAGSLFVFSGPNRAVLVSYPSPQQLLGAFGGPAA
jgi:cyclase